MKQTIRTGLCFGTTTGIITTLGLMVGVESGTKSVLAVIGAVLTIAIADAFSDTLGMHISQESEAKKSRKQVWESTLSTFISKIFIGFTFIVPVLLFDLQTAIILSISWAVILLSALNFYMAKEKGVNPWPVITQHVGIALVVVVITHFIGEWISLTFV
jgi:VIT1/CCC1 family predicted Fe2+/Mn2+ transporter